MRRQLQLYGKQILISLIDQKGSESLVGDEYETQVRLFDHDEIQYIAFDFHEECKNNNYNPLKRLVQSISDSLIVHSFFLRSEDKIIRSIQKGSVRTNCIDCLDRTNVVQSVIAKSILKYQFVALEIFNLDDEIDNFHHLKQMLNQIWSINADTMSKRYTGVGALKTEFTRTGKRSAKGTMADGVKSVSRIYQNAFYDNEKQFATDLFLCKFKLERNSLVCFFLLLFYLSFINN